MPDLPHLPFGLEYAALGAAILALVGGVVQQVFADRLQAFCRRLWRALTHNRGRRISADEWTRYRTWVGDTYNTMKLGFLRDGGSVTLDDVYVPLQYEQDGNRVDIYRDIQSRLRTLVVGPAGAGKSMLLRHSMLRWANEPERTSRVPVLVEAARFNRGGGTVAQLIVETCGRRVEDRGGRRRHKRPVLRPLVTDAERVVREALDAGQLCVFLDGLDEVLTDRRAAVAEEIKDFATSNPTCQIVVTCRDAVYDNDLAPVFEEHEQVTVAGFDDAGIRHFLRLWFTRHETPGEPDALDDPVGNLAPDPRAQVEQLMAALRANPTLMRLARSPLMLTMITSLHDADPGEGPMLTNSRAEFYEQAITHLLRRDPDLGRNRELTRYRWAHKLMALRAIALAAQGGLTAGSDHRILTEDEVYEVMTRLRPRFQLPESDLPRMVDEIITRSGLLTRIDDSNLLYEFAHLTLQEYLAAVELAAAPDRLLTLYRDNPARWRETVKLWCAGANRDASDLVRQLFAGGSRDRMLALECVADARQIDDVLATHIVREFLRQLGEEVPEKHRMLAALGAVAGEPGAIGQDLFANLSDLARSGGQVGLDAIVALAESRRLAAIETLSELAETESAARVALRTIGELAIPVLARKAGEGSVAAVDDLAAIGTPAAAVAIAEQLWGADKVAVRAAWRLAVLISAPDVEGELGRFDPARFQRGDQGWYDWLWAPFVARHVERHGLPVTVGRIGWLIDHSTDDDLPLGLGQVDPRLALGLGARSGFLNTVELPEELRDRLLSESRRFVSQRLSRPTAPLDMALADIYQADAEEGTALAKEVVAAKVTSWPARLLLSHLSDPLTVELARRILEGFVNADVRDWRALNARAEHPKVLLAVREIAVWTSVVLVVAAVVLAGVRSVGTLIGWWSWGPGWLAATTLLGTALAVTIAIVEDQHPNVYHDLIIVPGLLLGASAAAVGTAILAGVTVAGWLGWPAVAAIATVATAATAILSPWANRRERAMRNPYRAILRLHPNIVGFDATVIAPRAAEQPSAESSSVMSGRG